VSRASIADGLKLHFHPGTWVLMRLSDTEPLARIYVAAEDDRTVSRLLNAGKKLLFGGNRL
jgi:phosphomannomutase